MLASKPVIPLTQSQGRSWIGQPVPSWVAEGQA